MPWAKNAFENVTTVYSEMLAKIGKKKFDNAHLAHQELLIRGEVIKRNFTKRQMNIIALIFTLSFYLGKEKAIIPKMQDFEIAGISKIKIRNELKQLVDLNVIDWNEEEHTFGIKDIREWKVKYHSGYNDERAEEIFNLNLKDSLKG